jgi:hypothetical protein
LGCRPIGTAASQTEKSRHDDGTRRDHLSLGALMIVLALTNFWFFTQVPGYVL